MSGYAIDWAMQRATDKKLRPPAARATLAALAGHANVRTGLAYVGTELLAYQTGFSERTIWRHLAAIKRAGIVPFERRFSGGRPRATLYHFPPVPQRQADQPCQTTRVNPDKTRGLTLSGMSGESVLNPFEPARGATRNNLSAPSAPPKKPRYPDGAFTDERGTFLPGTGWVKS